MIKKVIGLFVLFLFFSTSANAFDYGVRLGYERSEHDCNFTNPRVTSKVGECGNEYNGSLGLVITKELSNDNFVETELGYIFGDRIFTSHWAPFNTNKQEITVEEHPRALVVLGKRITSNDMVVSPVIGLGFARFDVKGAQGASNDPFDKKTNDNLLWTVGASFSQTDSEWSLDYRYIDYGNVETGIGVSSTRDERLHGDMTSHTIGISYNF